MVGYLIGLGDRHGENVTLEAASGDTVHVDLNLLFNAGAALRIPEIVPFRLTHNMVDAFGPCGLQGPFRLSCETALGVMRRQKDLLVASLRPFVFDPLVDWIVPEVQDRKKQKGLPKDPTGEVVNEKGLETLKAIEARLGGFVDENLGGRSGGGGGGPRSHRDQRRSTNPNVSLSVAGQVQHLIKEATSKENLSQMYIGWGAHM